MRLRMRLRICRPRYQLEEVPAEAELAAEAAGTLVNPAGRITRVILQSTRRRGRMIFQAHTGLCNGKVGSVAGGDVEIPSDLDGTLDLVSLSAAGRLGVLSHSRIFPAERAGEPIITLAGF